MYKCKKCEYITEIISEIANHYKYHHKEEEIYECEKCNKILKSKGGLSYHMKFCNGPKIKKICPKCNYEIKSHYEKHFNYCNGEGPRRKRKKLGLNWAKGLTKYTDIRLKKRSEQLKGRNGTKHTEETKKKLSKIIIDRYNNGWQSTAGRCKKLSYFSPIAGHIEIDGNWEYRVCIYLDKIGVNWHRNTKRFSYFNYLKNKNSTYCPDFYVENWESYIEVKGYKTELDEIKWKQFEYKLEIWDKNKLDSIGIDTKYRKNDLSSE